jgi:hypothetical protein
MLCCTPSLETNRCEDLGGNSTPEGTQAVHSFFFCFGFNVRMMFMLLQVLQPELEETSIGEDLPSDESTSAKHRERLTPIMRRVLPALRQYSIWLVSQVSLIIAPLERGATNIHIKELWKMYADVLTQLVNVFPPLEIKSVRYLLEEDENTIGFKPFWDPKYPQDCNPYLDDVSHTLKSRLTDHGVERHLPVMEMHSRIRDILLCGLVLQAQDQYPDVPMTVRDGVFVYIEEGLPMANVTSPVQSFPPSHTPNITAQTSTQPDVHQKVNGNTLVVPARSIAASDSHASTDNEMNRLVDDLVEPPKNKPSGSDETSYGMHSFTANEIFPHISSNRNHHTRVQSIPKILPSLPGYGSKTWAPQPDELNYSPGGRNTGFTATLSPFGVGPSHPRVEGAVHVGQATGYGSMAQRPWEENQPPLSPKSPTNNQHSHEQIARSAISLTMDSDFMDNSSVYANTPAFGNRRVTSAGLRTAAVLANGNNSTFYPGASEFDTEMMLRSSIVPIGSQRRKVDDSQTPPSGQGG